ncbi:MAG: Stp1/IreP family PP2C-type Ser/Thr phosphatase, partial [Eggerthellaceae bacterium]|nr:Stp1/IreP family PP2C-type Ser/Thr phosphatase [Eggerthellaceae bacterium]MCF0177635.1 Stp1/IreP family PP2C-type Ser/Thr phosphatase [Bacteroidales bacterium]
IGLSRDHNEDNLLAQGKHFAVADGMGGHAAGEVASEICIATLDEFLSQSADAKTLEMAVRAANTRIIEATIQDTSLMGMGTTLTAAIVDKNQLIIAQVGDSRAYLFHEGRIQRLTRDHSLMEELISSGHLTEEEARYHKDRSKITRALGSDPNTFPDMYNITIESGDRLLLCSDGLHGMITDREIERQLCHSDPQEACNGLVQKALDAGGNDNVTCIVVDIAGKMKCKQKKKYGGTSKVVVITVAVLLLLAIAGAFCGFNVWMRNSAYLADQKGKIAVYKGMPTSYGPFSYSELDQVTDVNLSDITTPSLVDRIKNKQIICSSLGEAWYFVDVYKDDIDKNKKKKEEGQKKSKAANSSSTNTDSNTNIQNNSSSTNTTQQ